MKKSFSFLRLSFAKVSILVSFLFSVPAWPSGEVENLSTPIDSFFDQKRRVVNLMHRDAAYFQSVHVTLPEKSNGYDFFAHSFKINPCAKELETLDVKEIYCLSTDGSIKDFEGLLLQHYGLTLKNLFSGNNPDLPSYATMRETNRFSQLVEMVHDHATIAMNSRDVQEKYDHNRMIQKIFQNLGQLCRDPEIFVGFVTYYQAVLRSKSSDELPKYVQKYQAYWKCIKKPDDEKLSTYDYLMSGLLGSIQLKENYRIEMTDGSVVSWSMPNGSVDCPYTNILRTLKCEKEGVVWMSYYAFKAIPKEGYIAILKALEEKYPNPKGSLSDWGSDIFNYNVVLPSKTFRLPFCLDQWRLLMGRQEYYEKNNDEKKVQKYLDGLFDFFMGLEPSVYHELHNLLAFEDQKIKRLKSNTCLRQEVLERFYRDFPDFFSVQNKENPFTSEQDKKWIKDAKSALMNQERSVEDIAKEFLGDKKKTKAKPRKKNQPKGSVSRSQTPKTGTVKIEEPTKKKRVKKDRVPPTVSPTISETTIDDTEGFTKITRRKKKQAIPGDSKPHPKPQTKRAKGALQPLQEPKAKSALKVQEAQPQKDSPEIKENPKEIPKEKQPEKPAVVAKETKNEPPLSMDEKENQGGQGASKQKNKGAGKPSRLKVLGKTVKLGVKAVSTKFTKKKEEGSEKSIVDHIAQMSYDYLHDGDVLNSNKVREYVQAVTRATDHANRIAAWESYLRIEQAAVGTHEYNRLYGEFCQVIEGLQQRDQIIAQQAKEIERLNAILKEHGIKEENAGEEQPS